MWLTTFGWRVSGEMPESPHAVLIANPHTTNWDGVFMIATAWVFRIKLHWIGKRSLTSGPFGAILRNFGAVGIDRTKPGGQVGQVALRIREADGMFLAIAPAATRSKREFWKSGFYHIAQEAGVPIVPAFVDWGTKHGGVGPAITTTGDIVADMAQIRAFYDGMKGKFPDQQTPILLREEADHADA
jgi:1-acyl-sn-glycerol-3-phosphate acyltransferase